MTDNKNPFTQREKAEVLRNDTYFRRAAVGLDLDSPGGRFRSEEAISGTTPAVHYPKLPSSSPWASDNVGVEPPLGVSIEDQQPTGEAFEVDRSLELATSSSAPPGFASPGIVGDVAAAKVTGPSGSLVSPDVDPALAVPTRAQLDELARVLPQLVKRRRSP